MQCGFNTGELVATRVEKANECPEIYVRSVRKFALSTTLEVESARAAVPLVLLGGGELLWAARPLYLAHSWRDDTNRLLDRFADVDHARHVRCAPETSAALSRGDLCGDLSGVSWMGRSAPILALPPVRVPSTSSGLMRQGTCRMVHHLRGEMLSVGAACPKRSGCPREYFCWAGSGARSTIRPARANGIQLVRWATAPGDNSTTASMVSSSSPYQGDGSWYIRFNAPGCYGLQIDWLNGTEWIIFRATKT